MHISYEQFHREVASGTKSVFILTAFCVGLALVSALLGFTHAVTTFKQAAIGVSYVFAVLLALLIVSFVLGAVMRWHARRRASHS